MIYGYKIAWYNWNDHIIWRIYVDDICSSMGDPRCSLERKAVALNWGSLWEVWISFEKNAIQLATKNESYQIYSKPALGLQQVPVGST